MIGFDIRLRAPARPILEAFFYTPRDQIAFLVRKDTRKGRIPDVTRFFLHTRGTNSATIVRAAVHLIPPRLNRVIQNTQRPPTLPGTDISLWYPTSLP
jgi:hypothetical protein